MEYNTINTAQFERGKGKTLVVISNSEPKIPIGIMYLPVNEDSMNKNWRIGLVENAFELSTDSFFRVKAKEAIIFAWEK